MKVLRKVEICGGYKFNPRESFFNMDMPIQKKKNYEKMHLRTFKIIFYSLHVIKFVENLKNYRWNFKIASYFSG